MRSGFFAVFVHSLSAMLCCSYKHELDLEGESGVIARAYGTACTIRKIVPQDGVAKGKGTPGTPSYYYSSCPSTPTAHSTRTFFKLKHAHSQLCK